MPEIRPKIQTGYRVGKLTVGSRTEQRKSGYTVWQCSCDCGGEIFLDTRCLQRGTVTDCGCATAVKPGMIDLTGKRFGRLVCVRLAEEKDNSGNTQWVCRCDCGNTCLAALHQLRSGYKKSCGCLGHPPIKDYIGKRFNKLTVIEYAGKQNGMHRWRCVCDCGRETVVGQTRLQSGKTKSCGCLNRSRVRKPVKKIKIKIENPRGLVDGTCVPALVARMSNPPIASNTSGYNGVYKNSNGTWSAQITFKRKTYYLGSFTDIQDAVAARKQSEEMYEDFISWYNEQHRETADTAVSAPAALV